MPTPSWLPPPPSRLCPIVLPFRHDGDISGEIKTVSTDIFHPERDQEIKYFLDACLTKLVAVLLVARKSVF